jgi:hypothetical protein
MPKSQRSDTIARCYFLLNERDLRESVNANVRANGHPHTQQLCRPNPVRR